MKLMPASRALAMIRAEVASSVGPPNIMVPRQIGEIFRPLWPRLRYCIGGGSSEFRSSFRDGPKDQTRNLEIPGSMLQHRPGMTALFQLSSRIALIRRNLDQAAIGIPAVDRAQRAAGALFRHRAFLDRHTTRVQMRHHLLRRA